MKYKIVSVVMFFVFSVNAHSFVECTRTIERIFTGYSASGSKVHVNFVNSPSAGVIQLSYVNNDETYVDRMLSVLLSAHMSGKTVTLRFAAGIDGSAASCTSSTSQVIQAVWIN